MNIEEESISTKEIMFWLLNLACITCQSYNPDELVPIELSRSFFIRSSFYLITKAEKNVHVSRLQYYADPHLNWSSTGGEGIPSPSQMARNRR